MVRLSDVPWWYLVVAILVSCYQAYRGFMFQWILGIKAINTKGQRVVLLCLADTITYLLSTMSGFISLFFFHQLTSVQEPNHSVLTHARPSRLFTHRVRFPMVWHP